MKKKSQLSDEEKAIFKKEMEGVRPLKKSGKVQTKSQPSSDKLKTARASLSKAPSSTTENRLSDHISETVDSESSLSYHKSGVQPRKLRKLHQGDIPITAELDLHGYRVEAAREKLWHFIHESAHLQHRCVRVIHGKGMRSAQPAKMKNLVNTWLRQIDLVLAFTSSMPRDGGTGAVNILLKKTS